MGLRNYFVKLDSSTTIKEVEEFVNHHNNYENYFSQDQLDIMEKEDTLPGEELILRVIFDEIDNVYYAYLINYGGMGHTYEWQQKYFPKINLLAPHDIPDDNKETWKVWPIYNVTEYQKFNSQLKLS